MLKKILDVPSQIRRILAREAIACSFESEGNRVPFLQNNDAGSALNRTVERSLKAIGRIVKIISRMACLT
jgi:hypothetical protein